MGLVAIVAIALHGLLLSLAPLAAAASNDPFSVICHSVPQPASSDDRSPASPDAGGAGCDHCNLCSAAAGLPTLDHVIAGQLLPARVTDVLRPVSTAATISLATTPKLARGPPQSA